MTRKRKPGPKRVIVIDRLRPFTDDTWIVVVQYLDEDGASPATIAEALNRDPRDVAARIREAAANGVLDKARQWLVNHGMVYAQRMARFQRDRAV